MGATQRDEHENESNFEYHEKETYFRTWIGVGNLLVVSKKSDFGATHYINLKKTAKKFKNFTFDIFGPFLKNLTYAIVLRAKNQCL